MLKKCTKCLEEKPATSEHFGKNSKTKDRLFHWCKACVKINTKAYYDANRARLIKQATEKVSFLRRTSEAFREAERIATRERKRRKLSDPQAYEDHLERGRRWRKENPEKVKALKHEQPERKAERQMRRYAAKRNATPGWANHGEISAIYAEARFLTEATGIKHEVDHIVPLRGKNVCGLHVAQNLRVITGEENRRKNNKLLSCLLNVTLKEPIYE